MKGNYITKINRVLLYLFLNPKKVIFYFKMGPLSKATPLQLGLPWFSLTSIEFLDKWLTKSMDVFEYGSGGSTIFFANRCQSVVSIENNLFWFKELKHKIDESGFLNIRLQYIEYNFHYSHDFENSEYLNSIPEKKFDIIVIDCAEESNPVRPLCFYHAQTKIKKGGIIIVDDSWRYPEIRITNQAKSFKKFVSIGPCRMGVTSTDIYFY